MSKLKSPEQVQAWLMALEAERFDTSWRRKPQQSPQIPAQRAPAPTQTTKPNKPSLEELRARYDRDALFYHAGRFAAGARDEEATNAFKEMAKMRKMK